MKNLGVTEIIFISLVVFALFGFGWMARARALMRKTRRILRPGAEAPPDRPRARQRWLTRR